MRSGNPVLKESTFLDLGSGAVVSRDGDTMSLNGTVNKTGFLLLLTVLTAAFAWNQALGADGTPAPGFGVYVWGGAIGGLVIARVTAFKKEWSPTTAPLYAVVEGVFVGGVSAIFGKTKNRDMCLGTPSVCVLWFWWRCGYSSLVQPKRPASAAGGFVNQ